MIQLFINIGIVTTLFYLLIRDYQHQQWRQAACRLFDQMKDRLISHGDHLTSHSEFVKNPRETLRIHMEDIFSANEAISKLESSHAGLQDTTKAWMEGINNLNLIHGSDIEKLKKQSTINTDAVQILTRLRRMFKEML